jgi:hypothetical protein
MLKATGLLAAALLLISPGAAYSRSQARPKTLVWANGKILSFAQDGNQIAWASYPPDSPHRACQGEVRIRLLGEHQQKRVFCQHTDDGVFDTYSLSRLRNPIGFSLAGRRALWEVAYCGNNCYQQLETASYSKRVRDLLEEELVWDSEWHSGDYVTAIAGDSSTLVYGVATPNYSSGCGEDDPGVCTITVSGGIKRVTDKSTVTVPGAPPPFIMAASGRRIALVVAETERPGPGSPAYAVVIDAVTGENVGSFTAIGKPQAIAYSTSAVGVLTSVSGEKQVEFYSPTGEPIRSVVVPAGATDLSMAGMKAVFRVGKSIRTVGVRAESVRQIATAKAEPIGLSIEGKRVAWAENVKIHGVQRGRIRAITIR